MSGAKFFSFQHLRKSSYLFYLIISRLSPRQCSYFHNKVKYYLFIYYFFSLLFSVPLFFSVSFPSLPATKPANPRPQINYHNHHSHHHGTTKPQPPSRQPQGQPKNQQTTGKKQKHNQQKKPKNKIHRATTIPTNPRPMNPTTNTDPRTPPPTLLHRPIPTATSRPTKSTATHGLIKSPPPLQQPTTQSKPIPTTTNRPTTTVTKTHQEKPKRDPHSLTHDMIHHFQDPRRDPS